MVLMPYGRVVSPDKLHHDHIGPMAIAASYWLPASIAHEHLRNQSRAAVRRPSSVTMCQVGAGVLHLVLENDDVLAAETRRQVNLGAHFMQLLGLQICDRTAQTAADKQQPSRTLESRSRAERTDKIAGRSPSFQRAERHRRCADLLENDRDGTFSAVKICDRERRYARLLQRHAWDDEQPALLRDGVRCLDHHQLGVCVQRLLFQNLIHSFSYLLAIVASNILHYTVSL